jgi:hypothetical protein
MRSNPIYRICGGSIRLGVSVLAERRCGNRTNAITCGEATSGRWPDFPELTVPSVPEDRLFVPGDNRDQSRDRRDFGCIAIGDQIGPVQSVYWPAATWRRFGVVDS